MFWGERSRGPIRLLTVPWIHTIMISLVKYVDPASFPEIIVLYSQALLFTTCLNIFLCYRFLFL